jgi:N-acetylmuramoyl-L-alanine amidase
VNFLWLLCLPLSAAAGELRGIDLESRDSATVVALTLDARTKAKVFALDNPRRLVVDLPATRRAAGLRLPVAESVISGIRQGPQPGGRLRVVIDLKSDVRFEERWSLADDPRARHRLSITLTPRTLAARAPAPWRPGGPG